MKPKSPRERILMLILPGALILLVYAFFFRPSLQNRLEAAEQAVAKLREEPVTADGVRRLARERDDLQRQEQTLTQLLAGVETDSILPADFARSDSRARALGEITRLITANDLLLIDQAPVSTSDAAPSEGLQQLIQSITSSLPASAEPSFRRLRFVGGYENAYRMLRQLANSNQPVLPVSIRMEQIESDPRLRWEFVVWM